MYWQARSKSTEIVLDTAYTSDNLSTIRVCFRSFIYQELSYSNDPTYQAIKNIDFALPIHLSDDCF